MRNPIHYAMKAYKMQSASFDIDTAVPGLVSSQTAVHTFPDVSLCSIFATVEMQWLKKFFIVRLVLSRPGVNILAISQKFTT